MIATLDGRGGYHLSKCPLGHILQIFLGQGLLIMLMWPLQGLLIEGMGK